MNILLVYPVYPESFWSFSHALKFVSKKASFPPLGLLTISSMLPEDWNKKLIDMNVSELTNKDILWADYVFLSAMTIQSESVIAIMSRCKQLKKKIVAGGSLFTSSPEYYDIIDHLILNEAELTLPKFLKDLEEKKLIHKYESTEWADLNTSVIPDWSLIEMNKYTSMNLQYSRGCPYDCEFCDITILYGRESRTKTKEQVISEMDALYFSGWRGAVFFVDDNFIGNKKKLKKEILPAIVTWMEMRKAPFRFNTEASINLSDDDELMDLMVKAGFEAVFVGIETPNDESLIECNKVQNRNRNLIKSIKKIQKVGLEVQAGFIVGFDNDPPDVFEDLIKFIQKSGIVTAMVGLLNAPKGSKLEKRLLNEDRMLRDFTGNNTDNSINFIPKMELEQLLIGYKSVIEKIYSPKYFYKRVMLFLKEFEPVKKSFRLEPSYVIAFFRSIVKLGILSEERIYYWKLFFWSLLRKPKIFSMAILFAIYGYHFRKVYNNL